MIATGFGDKSAAEPVLKRVVHEDLDIPTNIRRGNAGVSLPISGSLAYQPYEEDELDTRPFLRNKAD